MAVTLSPGIKIMLGSVLLILSRNWPPCGRLIVAGDCACAARGITTIMAVPNKNAGRLFFIRHLIEPTDTGKASGVLQTKPVGFYFRGRPGVTNPHFQHATYIDAAVNGIDIDFCGVERGIHIIGFNLCGLFLEDFFKFLRPLVRQKTSEKRGWNRPFQARH